MEWTELQVGSKLVKLALKGELPLEVFLREEESIPGLRLFLLIVHWLVLFGIGLRTWLNREFYAQPLQQARLSILFGAMALFALYLASLTPMELCRSKVAQRPLYVWMKVVLDTLFFSAFYVLTGREESDFFLLYLLPLFIAIERLNFRKFVITALFMWVCLGGSLLLLAPTAMRPSYELALNIFLPRSLFLLFAGMTGLFLRQMARVQKSTFLGLLATMGSGISVIDKDMRLLWINEFERKLAPAAQPGQHCYRAFHSQDGVCQGCPVEQVFRTGRVYKHTVSHQVRGEERLYELNSGPIKGQGGKIGAVLSVVSDVTEREKQRRRLDILQRISSLVRTTEIDQPERLEDVLWRILAGVVATDGVGFERVILVLEQDGTLRGKLGTGPVNREDANRQWKQWKQKDLPWTYKQIGSMRGDARLLSSGLNRRISQVMFSNQLSNALQRILEEDGVPRARLIKKELQSDPTWHLLYAELPGDLELNTFAIAPLFSKGVLIGVLLADDVITRRSLHDNSKDLDDLQLFANQAAIAVESARSLIELQGTVRELAELQRTLEALYQTSLEMSAKQLDIDIEDLLRAIVQRATQLLGAQGGSIFLRVPGEAEVRIVVTYNLESLLGIRLKFGEGMAGKVAQSGEPKIVNDYHNWPERAPLFDQEPYRGLFKAVVQVPLKWQSSVTGVLAISDIAEGRKFSEQDIQLLERFASAAALAIGNAMTYSYLQTLVNNSPNAIIAVDRKGLVTQFNQASERILGFRKEDVLGQPVARYYYDGETEARRINHLLIENDQRGEQVRNVQTYVRGSHDERIPIRFAGTLLRDAFGERIGSIGLMTDLREIEFLAHEYQDQQGFLARLEHYPQDVPINSLADLRERWAKLLEMVRGFCQLEYVVLFASVGEDETVLQAVAWVGLPSHIESQLPHFNWRKAGLQPLADSRADILRLEADLVTKWMPDDEWRQKIVTGIRGHNADFFASLSCGVPTRLAANYRSVLVFGPFAGEPNLLSMTSFLENVALTVNLSALSWLQALYLRDRRKDAETSAQLIVHRARLNLIQVTGKFGLIKRSPDAGGRARQVAEEGERLIKNLSRVIGQTLRPRFAEMEPEDFEFPLYPLSALVQNCVESFNEQARSGGRKLVLDFSVEYLPYAEVDPVALSVALGNLIDNALKYSFEGTFVRVFSEHDTQCATITVEDLGEQMPEEARSNLIQPGRRWAMSARARRIPGMGLGLWDASAIAAVHGGTIDFANVSQKQHRGRLAHLVQVSITLPLQRQ